MQPPPLQTPMFYEDGVTLSAPWQHWFTLLVTGALGGTTSNKLFYITDYGAVDGGASALGIQAAVDAAKAAGGGCVYTPRGRYLVSSEILLNYGSNFVFGQGVSFDGDGVDCAEWIWDGADTRVAAAPGTATKSVLKITANTAFIQGLSIKGFSIGPSITPYKVNFVHGLTIENAADVCFDLWIHGMDRNLVLNGVLSSRFDGQLTDGNYGGYAYNTASSLSSCNANFFNIVLGGNAYGGFDYINGGAIFTGNCENNGYLAGANAYGVHQRRFDYTDATYPQLGAAGVAIDASKMYFEGNGSTAPGVADLWITSELDESIVINLDGFTVNRLGTGHPLHAMGGGWCKNNVLIEQNGPGTGDIVVLNVERTSFRNYLGYTPDVANKYIDITSTSGSARSVTVGKNFYQDGIEVPDFHALSQPVWQSSFFGALNVNQFTTPYRGALLYKTSDQNIATAIGTDVTWDAADDDTEGFYDAGDPTKLTVPVGSGVRKVRVGVGIEWDNAGAGSGIRTVNIRKNGGAFIGQMQLGAGVGASVLPSGESGWTPVLVVAEGDYFEVRVTQSSGITIPVIAGGAGGNPTWFAIEAVRGGNS